MTSRRDFLKMSGAAAAGLYLTTRSGWIRRVFAFPPLDLLDPVEAGIPKYVTPIIIPPAMPISKVSRKGKEEVDFYRIAVREFNQYLLPKQWSMDNNLGSTPVWSYGSKDYPGTVAEGGTFNYPAFTIEAQYGRTVRVEWINDLKNPDGTFLPHLLPVDQTLHWANPPGGKRRRDTRGFDPNPYLGPVPMVTHVHGAHTHEQWDGYPEAWYLPDATNIPGRYAKTGTWYDNFVKKYKLSWDEGTAVFEYRNDQRATTLWYHDHSLGMTRLNVYAGPAGFYLIRGGGDDLPGLPGPAPGPFPGNFGGPHYEIPIVIQDRSFKIDGSLFYPEHRAFFGGLDPEDFGNIFIPDPACNGPSDVPPIWQPEFFGNVMVTNGVSWPDLEVEPRKYRFRFLNGCNSRFLILKMVSNPLVERPAMSSLDFTQIGAEGGFLPGPVVLSELLMSPAERADVIVDFSGLAGQEIYLINEGPDDPFGGGTVGIDFDAADPESTGQVMRFKVVAGSSDSITIPASFPDTTVPLPAITPVRKVSLNEEESKTVMVLVDENEEWVTPVNLACDDPDAVPFGPTAALLGQVDQAGDGVPLLWNDAPTETPTAGDTETWEIYNYTEDAHPIHVHLVQFKVVGREVIGGGTSVAGDNDPMPWETGWKDTVIAYPGEVTTIKARFDIPGLYVWHCHIVEHEDNEMMRPYRVEEP